MKIAIDGFQLNRSFTGVGRYLLNLLQAILKIDTVNIYTLFLKEPLTFDLKADNLIIEVMEYNKSHTRWQNFLLLKELKKGKFDLFFSPDHSLPLFYKGRSFLTIHDPSWKTQKSDYSLKERIVRDLKTRISLKKAERIFAVSQFTKSETLKYYKVPQEKILPIHSGVEGEFKRSSAIAIKTFKKKYHLNGFQVIGFLGSMFKRRHLKEIIQAFLLLKHRKIKLFLVGKNFFDKDLWFLKQKDIIWIARIPEKEINDFYSSLDLFLYLSDYEGFGFPPMEALLCHTPSLLLRTSSLKEIFSDFAFFINNTKPELIKKEILNILNHQGSQKLKLLKNFQEKRIFYSWERAAKEYLQYFK